MECDAGHSLFFIEPWCTYVDDIQHINDFLGLGFWAVDSILKLVVYISAGFIIWGGVKYMLAQGDSGAVADAKSTITNAVIGLVIAIASVAIVQFVQGVL